MDITWNDLTGRLAAFIADARAGSRLTLGDAERPDVYVQVAIDPDEIVIEAVSDEFLDPARRLTDAQRMQMMALGWTAPEESSVGINWEALFGRPIGAADVNNAALMLVGALRDVHGVPVPSRLEQSAFRDETDEADALDPLPVELGIGPEAIIEEIPKPWYRRFFGGSR